MTEEGRGDIGEFIVSLEANADQLLIYAGQLKMQTNELSDIKGRKETSATLCAIEQALAQITESAKQIGKDRHNAALVLGMDELIATQHKTLDQFAEEEAIAAEVEYAAQEAMDQDEADAEAARLADEEAEMNAMSNEYEEYAEGEYD